MQFSGPGYSFHYAIRQPNDRYQSAVDDQAANGGRAAEADLHRRHGKGYSRLEEGPIIPCYLAYNGHYLDGSRA